MQLKTARSIRFKRQAEAAECGLTCLAMIGEALGLPVDLPDLRRRFSIGLRGSTLHQVIQIASLIGLDSRAVRVEPEDLGELSTPCVLHWDMNHFVVLESVSRGRYVIHDPAVGMRVMSAVQVGKHFTGVALELQSAEPISTAPPPARIRLSHLTGRVTGLRSAIARIVLMALALEAFSVFGPLIGQIVIDESVSTGDLGVLVQIGVGFVCLLVIQVALSFGRSWMILALSQQLATTWKSNVFSHLVRLPMVFFEQRHLGDIATRFGSVDAIQRTVTTTAIEGLIDGVMASIALAIMLRYSPLLTGVVLAATLLYCLLRWALYRPLAVASEEAISCTAEEQTTFLETMRAIMPIKLFGRESERHARWFNRVVEVRNRSYRVKLLGIYFTVANSLVFGLENIAVFCIGAYLAAGAGDGTPPTLTVGMLFAFVSYKLQFISRITRLVDHLTDLTMLGLHRERLADIALESPELDKRAAQPNHGGTPVRIELKDVSFRYGELEPWILRNVNLTISEGDSIAITGPSGAGKTTLVKLLLGLLEPTSGQILVGDQDIRKYGLANYRAMIGTVMQDDVLLTGTLAENISFFDTGSDMDKVVACAQVAQIHQEIEAMPMAYQTIVGDLGSGLSGGQKQRILLARALYKAPKLLVLDEATSHLDLANERTVNAALSERSITKVFVAHRPDTIASARAVFSVAGGLVAAH